MLERETMDRFQTTIKHLCSEKPIKSERVAVLVCPPLTRKRFEKEKNETGFIASHFRRRKEFVRRHVIYEFPDWESYEESVVLYSFKDLLEIEECYSATVKLNVKFSYFKKIVRSRDYDVVFIIAHHIINTAEHKTNKMNIYVDEIEFANGGIPLEKINKFLSGLKPVETGNRKSFLFITCKSSELKEVNYGLPSLQSIAYAFWEIDFPNSVIFVRQWIRFLNGNHTLSQAYHLALNAIVKENLEE